MKAPISWLKEYTKINSNISDLMWKMTEIGLTCETYTDVGNEKVLDIEVTPNRPDWLSITGIAREIATIENNQFNLPNLPKINKPEKNLPININIPKHLVGKYAGITICDVAVSDSPKWLQERLIFVGLRPINNLVDITNYVMFELGIPIHVFDYDKFLTHNLSMELSIGGEVFTSVDGLKYILPQNTLIIKDKERVIDLCGIKGGQNTCISNSTKNIYIHVPIYSPQLIRKTSIALGLASDASYIYERGPSTKLVPDVLERVVSLVLENAKGKVSSKIIDIDSTKNKINKININIDDIKNIIGIDLPKNNITKILSELGFNPKSVNNKITCQIPNHRVDIKIKEDICEEIARIYGYNNLPKTIPENSVTTQNIPYSYDRNFELYLKNIAITLGFNEINTQALTSKDQIIKFQLNLENHIKINNPVSLEYEFMRSTLIPNLIDACLLNQAEEYVFLFEYNKTYLPPVENHSETHKISFLIKNKGYRFIKNVLDTYLSKLNLEKVSIKKFIIKKDLWHPNYAFVIEKNGIEIGIIGEINPVVLNSLGIDYPIYCLELNCNNLLNLTTDTKYKSIPKYPPQIEDITIEIPKGIYFEKVIETIKNVSSRIYKIELIDTFKDKYTLRIQYLDPDKTLDDKEVEKIRIKYKNDLKKYHTIKI